MTFLVEMSVNGTGMMVRSSGGNNCFTSLLVKRIDETPAVIALRECPAYILLYQFSPKDTGQSKVK